MATEEPSGLSVAEAALRLEKEGPNELVSREHATLLANVAALVREPMTLLLLACGAIYFVLGDAHEALMLLGFVVFILVLTLVQERKTERALEALRDLSSPRALVVRDGARLRIAGREVVRGDLVVLSEGDRVPADATLLTTSHLAVDESLLTGEPASVRKAPWDGEAEVARPGGEDLPFVYAGTLVVQGSALGRVHATGARTEIGRIGQALQIEKRTETSLQRETRKLVVRLAWIGAALSMLVVAIRGATTGAWLEAVLAGITLAMAILPNEFPVIVTLFLSLGAFRLSKKRVLTRTVPGIEALGSATVLCVDKTGTLTKNKMTVRALLVDGESFEVEAYAGAELPEDVHELVELSILASRPDPFDPMEVAFKELGNRFLRHTEHLHPEWSLVREYPLTRELLAVTQAWRAPPEGTLTVAAKGAPEAICDLCHMDEAAVARVAKDAAELAARGLRVLAVARGNGEGADTAARAHDLEYRFVGLLGLTDPLRDDVPQAIRECRAAGIRVVMITGDHPTTAAHIAAQAGLGEGLVVLTGAELAALDVPERERRMRQAAIFARVLPEQKLEIVQALRASGEIVAMTGDGVNDAPALRAADIGVAMGARGTDVAREAATLVLLDDDFASLVAAVRAGRRILDNLRKALAYILAVHLPIVALTLAPVSFGYPLVLFPIHIAFLHLLIDPACSIVFEAEPDEPGIMSRPPRAPQAPLFGTRALVLALAQGFVASAVVVALYVTALRRGATAEEARALTFLAFMCQNLGLILVNRSWSAAHGRRAPNRALLYVMAGAFAFLAVVIYAPGARDLFGFFPLAPRAAFLGVTAGFASASWFELYKRWRPPAAA